MYVLVCRLAEYGLKIRKSCPLCHYFIHNGGSSIKLDAVVNALRERSFFINDTSYARILAWRQVEKKGNYYNGVQSTEFKEKALKKWVKEKVRSGEGRAVLGF